jgi:hypothetical protein
VDAGGQPPASASEDLLEHTMTTLLMIWLGLNLLFVAVMTWSGR